MKTTLTRAITIVAVFSAVLLITLSTVEGHSAGHGAPCNETQDENHDLHCDTGNKLECVNFKCECIEHYDVNSSHKCLHKGTLGHGGKCDEIQIGNYTSFCDAINGNLECVDGVCECMKGFEADSSHKCVSGAITGVNISTPLVLLGLLVFKMFSN